MDGRILVSEYGPDQEIPLDEPAEDGALARTMPYERAAQRRRLADAERKLGQLGRVNPLALEEYAALEQRHAFLPEQLPDLTHTRPDPMPTHHDPDERTPTGRASARKG